MYGKCDEATYMALTCSRVVLSLLLSCRISDQWAADCRLIAFGRTETFIKPLIAWALQIVLLGILNSISLPSKRGSLLVKENPAVKTSILSRGEQNSPSVSSPDFTDKSQKVFFFCISETTHTMYLEVH